MSGAPDAAVRTLSEQAFEVVRERIVSGVIAEDAPVRQDALAAELGVSKIPLREALARLEQEGLLISRPNRGYVVRPMSADQAEEIYALRLAIEPAAAGRACAEAGEAERAAVRTAVDRLDAAAADDLARVAVMNRDFHTALVRSAGRPLTAQLVERLSILSERYVVAHLKPAGREARAHAEHRDLLDAWLGGRAEAVEAQLASHIQGTLDDLRTEFGAATRGAESFLPG